MMHIAIGNRRKLFFYCEKKSDNVAARGDTLFLGEKISSIAFCNRYYIKSNRGELFKRHSKKINAA
jgi:hypothetical protein